VRSGNARGAMDGAAGSPPVPASCVFSPVIDRGTLAGHHRYQHHLAAYCQGCDRWALLDLAAMINAGHGERRLPITVRCQTCGEVGRLQVRPAGGSAHFQSSALGTLALIAVGLVIPQSPTWSSLMSSRNGLRPFCELCENAMR